MINEKLAEAIKNCVLAFMPHIPLVKSNDSETDEYFEFYKQKRTSKDLRKGWHKLSDRDKLKLLQLIIKDYIKQEIK